MAALLSLNQSLFFLIFDLPHNQLLNNLAIFAANDLIIITALAGLILAIFNKTYEKILVLSVISFLIGLILLRLLSLIIFEPRPFLTFSFQPLISGLANLNSFPSEHSLFLAIMTFSAGFCGSRFFKLLLVFLTLTGLARIYAGVHYPLDIIGGISFGFLAVWMGSKISNNLWPAE
jgi:undecaprenyl-diphosphatase